MSSKELTCRPEMPWKLSAAFCRFFCEVENRGLKGFIWLHRNMFILYKHCFEFIVVFHVTLFNWRFKNCNDWRCIVWTTALLSTLYTIRKINLKLKSVRIWLWVHNDINASRFFFHFDTTKNFANSDCQMFKLSFFEPKKECLNLVNQCKNKIFSFSFIFSFFQTELQ